MITSDDFDMAVKLYEQMMDGLGSHGGMDVTYLHKGVGKREDDIFNQIMKLIEAEPRTDKDLFVALAWGEERFMEFEKYIGKLSDMAGIFKGNDGKWRKV
jgi:hypothetical protein